MFFSNQQGLNHIGAHFIEKLTSTKANVLLLLSPPCCVQQHLIRMNDVLQPGRKPAKLNFCLNSSLLCEAQVCRIHVYIIFNRTTVHVKPVRLHTPRLAEKRKDTRVFNGACKLCCVHRAHSTPLHKLSLYTCFLSVDALSSNAIQDLLQITARYPTVRPASIINCCTNCKKISTLIPKASAGKH